MTDLSAIQLLLLIAAVGAVACLYSSVGHGGATGYLAVMALLGVAPVIARPGTLWMNCVVAGIAFWRFFSAGFFNLKLFVPLGASSIPFAWLGSRLHLEGRVYAVVLGIALLGAGYLLGWGHGARETRPVREPRLALAIPFGAALGFLAGLTGIGGGVFLTPLLIFFHWTVAKTAAGISALFIVVNSIAGLAGLGTGALFWRAEFIAPIVVAIAGALLGTYVGVRRWSTTGFRRALGIVLWIAAGKLLIGGR